jgi:hypothetical protein
MYTDKKKNKLLYLALILLPLAMCIPAIDLTYQSTSVNLKAESTLAIEQAVQKSARQCYVVEGVYPPDLKYLQDNYGLKINTEDYFVSYDAFADNLPPTIRVTARE